MLSGCFQASKLRALLTLFWATSGAAVYFKEACNASADEALTLSRGLLHTKYGGIFESKSLHLGAGAFGSVDLYTLKAPCQGEVVVKEISTRKDYSTEEIQAEIDILNSVTSPNIVKLYDSVLSSSSEPTYLFMEPAFGGVLHDAWAEKAGGWFGETGRFYSWFYTSAKEARKEVKAKLLSMALVGTLRGLKALHDQEIVHRDVKPDNIFAADSGNDCVQDMSCRFLVGDLGAAIKVDEYKNISGGKQLGFTRKPHGTVIYLPPEVRVGGIWCQYGDIWALGISLIEAFKQKLKEVRTPLTAEWVNGKLRDNIQNETWVPEDLRDLLSDMTQEGEDGVDFLKRPTASEALARAEAIVLKKYNITVPEGGSDPPACFTACRECSAGWSCSIDGDSVKCIEPAAAPDSQ